jgi:hypothetical protein
MRVNPMSIVRKLVAALTATKNLTESEKSNMTDRAKLDMIHVVAVTMLEEAEADIATLR